MRPLYTVLVWLVAAAHFAFLVYLPAGGFLALRWPPALWLHVPVVLWGVASLALHLECPLTVVEQWARGRAGMAPLGSTGFIDHYITGVVYPADAAGYVQAIVFLAVLGSWAANLVRRRQRRRRPAVAH